MTTKILAGYEVKTGRPVYFDLHHIACFGLTQKSGKTTLLEALIARSGKRAIAYRTKRGEAGFRNANLVPPYYKSRSDWQWLEGLVNVALSEKVKFEPGMRGAIIRVSEGTKGDLAKILAKAVRLEKDSRRGFEKELYHKLATYLHDVVENMSKFQFSETLNLSPGINVMELSSMEQYPEIQQLVVATSLAYIHENLSDIIAVVPEAWSFLPQGKMTPVKWAAERFVRKGAAIGNYLALDSQDIGGLDKTPLRQVGVWFMGKMMEAHEVERITKQLLGVKIPASEIQTLPLGHFFAVVDNKVFKMYALPLGVPADIGKAVAMGRMKPEMVQERYLKAPPEPPPRPIPPQQTEMQQVLARLDKIEGRQTAPRQDDAEMRVLLEKLDPVKETEPDPVPPVPPAPPAEPENSEEPKVLEVHEPIQVIGVKDPKLKIVVETTGLRGQIGQAILEGLVKPEKKLRLKDFRAILLQEFGTTYSEDDVMTELKTLVAPPYRLFIREITSNRINNFILRDRAKEQVVKA